MSEAPPPESSRAPWWPKLVVPLVALIVPVALVECGARLLVDPPPGHAFPGLSPGTMLDDEFLWSPDPSYKKADRHGPINDLGMRGPEVRLPRTPGMLRVLSLGESSAFGDGVPWSKAYARQLELELRRRGHRVEVWNGGVRAWSTVQSTRLLELEMERLDPDLVLFYHEVNDFLPTVFRAAEFRTAGLSDRDSMALSSGSSWALRIVRASRALTALSLARERRRADALIQQVSRDSDVDVILIQVLPWQRIAPAAPGQPLPWMDNPSPLVRVPDPEREEGLRRLIELVAAHGAELVLYHPAYRVSIPHRCMLNRLAEEHGVGVIEVEELLASDLRARDLTKDDYFLDDDPYHPNPRGHEVIARGTADFLEAEELLREPRVARDRHAKPAE